MHQAYRAFESRIHKEFVYCPSVFVYCLKKEDISETRWQVNQDRKIHTDHTSQAWKIHIPADMEELTRKKWVYLECINNKGPFYLFVHFAHYYMGESSKFWKSWTLDIQIWKHALCLQYTNNFQFKCSIVLIETENKWEMLL